MHKGRAWIVIRIYNPCMIPRELMSELVAVAAQMPVAQTM
jgi:hypothetical protein